VVWVAVAVMLVNLLGSIRGFQGLVRVFDEWIDPLVVVHLRPVRAG
jgi:hypothetical protein